MALQHSQPYRADYIWQAPNDSLRYEVIDGEIYVSAAPSRQHQHALSKLHILLGSHVYQVGAGDVYEAPFGVVLDELTGVEPDLVFISRERAHLLSDRGMEGPADFAVEVLSPSSRRVDRVLKMERYARGGIPHYWNIDPLALTLEVYRLSDGAYDLDADLRDDDQYSPPFLPSFTLPLAALWL